MKDVESLLSGLEVFMYLVQRSGICYYYGPAPPYSLLRHGAFSPYIMNRAAKLWMRETNRKHEHYKKRNDSPIDAIGRPEAFAPPGAHRSRKPSTLAIDSGLTEESLSIDSHGSQLNLKNQRGDYKGIQPKRPPSVKVKGRITTKLPKKLTNFAQQVAGGTKKTVKGPGTIGTGES